ncbi:proteasome assembly chaperone 1 [Euwallacea fornicatus]|uniref:proteasome assembly chaperone 1 n=1 Tax=Euwallacea fornicatus TaxID=995702 RepID=UPI00338EE07A
MLFGEIVEPNTRALLLDDEELEEVPQYQSPSYEWQGSPNPPATIETLFIGESKKVLQALLFVTLNSQQVAVLINEGLSIYKMDKNYLVTFERKSKDLVIGEIVELLSPWINSAKYIHCITSSPISAFQTLERTSNEITFSRCISTDVKVPYNFCKKLEAPNLIQGLSASVLTYCICCKISASLWVIYMDNMPLDSANGAEIVKLLGILGIKAAVDFKSDDLNSNLYI